MQCFPSLPCAAGLVCGDWTCVTAGGLGSACPCQDAYWCDPSGGFPGTCRAPQTRGTCTFPVGPGSSGSPLGACATGYHCDFGTSECAPIAAAGGDCSASPMACGAGYGCPAGTCVSWPKLGEACEGLPCIGGYCDRGASPARCVPYKTTGCTAHAECASFSCGSDGNCAPVVDCAAP